MSNETAVDRRYQVGIAEDLSHGFLSGSIEKELSVKKEGPLNHVASYVRYISNNAIIFVAIPIPLLWYGTS